VAKKKSSAYVCNDCGADYTKWQGQCSECNAWNTLSEVRMAVVKSSSSTGRGGYAGAGDAEVSLLSDIEIDELPRIPTGAGELDLVLGGGLVTGSCVLIGGEPGAGKSTLLLQTLCHLAENHKCLYVTGEESPQQVAMRARREPLSRFGLRRSFLVIELMMAIMRGTSLPWLTCCFR